MFQNNDCLSPVTWLTDSQSWKGILQNIKTDTEFKIMNLRSKMQDSINQDWLIFMFVTYSFCNDTSVI